MLRRIRRCDAHALNFDNEGWYHTGDLASLDLQGEITICGRISDIIIRGGENISAIEVEEVLRSHVAVAEVAIVGAQDERFGERVAAYVQRLLDATTPLTLRELRRHVREAGLAPQKLPEELHLIDEFPKNPIGKIQKFQLGETTTQRHEQTARDENER